MPRKTTIVSLTTTSVVLGLVILSTPIAARAEDKSVSFGEVVIVNETNTNLAFSLRSLDIEEEWWDYEVESGRNETFVCESPEEQYCEFKIVTGEMPLTYKLEATKRYGLFWNAKESRWDLYEITR